MPDDDLPPPPTGTVDTDRFGSLLRHVEQVIHRSGWDQPAEAMIIYDPDYAATDRYYRTILATHPDLGPAIRHAGYAAQPFLVPAILGGNNFGKLLLAMAADLAYGNPTTPTGRHAQTMLGVLRQPGVRGVAHIGEAWTRYVVGADEAHRLATGTTSLADMPGTVETRALYACDLHSRMYKVHRDRGHQPEIDTNHRHGAGTVQTAMRIFIAAITDTAPPADQARHTYPTVADFITAHMHPTEREVDKLHQEGTNTP